MKKWFFLILLLPAICWAAFGVDGVSSPAKVDGVASPAKVDGVTYNRTGTDYTNDANCQGAYLFADDLTDETTNSNDLAGEDTQTYTTDRPTGFTTGKSLDFDGTDDAIKIDTGDQSANYPGKDDQADAAVCLWFYHDDSTGDDQLFDFSTEWHFWVTNDDNIDGNIDDGTDDVIVADVSTGTAESRWEHWCFSFDGSDTDLTVWGSTEAAFGDIENGTDDDFASVDLVNGDGATAAFGRRTGPANYFDGHMYHLIIFNREITSLEASNMYNYGITGVD